jgi:hypothetical protein
MSRPVQLASRHESCPGRLLRPQTSQLAGWLSSHPAGRLSGQLISRPASRLVGWLAC